MRWLLLALLIGCGFPPFEPGSDLPEASVPAPVGGSDASLSDATAMTGSDVTGTFDMQGTLSALGMEIEVGFVGLFTQEGALESGATLQLELRSTDEPEEVGDTFPEPVSVDPEGRFEGTVVDLIIPAEFSDLLAGDATSDVIFTGRVLSSDCVDGLVGLQLKDAPVSISEMPISIRLDGTFQATRQGAECTFEEATE